MSKIDALAALYKAADNDVDCVEHDGDYAVIVAGEWEQDHKYQHATHIVRFDGEHFAVTENRSGSYHTDWHYGDAEIVPVERKVQIKEVVSWPATGKGVSVASRY